MILNISNIVESFNVLQNDMRRICDLFENIEERLSNIELTLYPITKVTTFSDWDDIENSILNEYIPNENQEVIISDANVCGLIIEGELVSSLYTLSDESSEIETTNKTLDSTKLYIGFNSFNTPKNWILLNERGEKVLTLKFSPAIFKVYTTSTSDPLHMLESILDEYIPIDNLVSINDLTQVEGLIIEGAYIGDLKTSPLISLHIDGERLYLRVNTNFDTIDFLFQEETILTIKAISLINHIWFYNSNSEELGDFDIPEENEGVLTISSNGRDNISIGSIRGIKLSGNNLTTDIHITSNDIDNLGITSETIDGKIFISCEEGIDTTPIILSKTLIGTMISSDKILLTINVNG